MSVNDLPIEQRFDNDRWVAGIVDHGPSTPELMGEIVDYVLDLRHALGDCVEGALPISRHHPRRKLYAKWSGVHQ